MIDQLQVQKKPYEAESLKELVIKKCRNELTIYAHRKNQSKFHKIGSGVNLHYKFNSSFPTKRLN